MSKENYVIFIPNFQIEGTKHETLTTLTSYYKDFRKDNFSPKEHAVCVSTHENPEYITFSFFNSTVALL